VGVERGVGERGQTGRAEWLVCSNLVLTDVITAHA